MVGSFNAKTLLDPRVFAAEVAARFAGYTEAVVEQTLRELQNESEWMPSIAKIAKTLQENHGIEQRRASYVPRERQIEQTPEPEQTPEQRKRMIALVDHISDARRHHDHAKLEEIRALSPDQHEAYLNRVGWEPKERVYDE